MGDKSRIEWTDATWNPVTGCTKVSAGCKHCYAERLSPRVFAGQVVEVDTTPPQHPEMKARGYRPRNFADVMCHTDRLNVPLKWQRPRRIFVNSMSDLFHDDVPDKFIDRVFAIMALCPQHTFQVLTKRSKRMLAYMDENKNPHKRVAEIVLEKHGQTSPCLGHLVDELEMGECWPLSNVWLCVSCEDQATADERVPLLLQTPAAVRGVSAEPLLGQIDLSIYMASGFTEPPQDDIIKWVIVGGESGASARPMHPDWVRSIRDQCQAASVPFFFKQWGEWGPVTYYAALGCDHDTLPTYQDDSYNTHALPVERFNEDWMLGRIGKKAAGRLLDGRTWDQFPI